MELQGKVILITGASSGIGKAVALALSHQHNQIILSARRAELLAQVAESISENGSEALAIPGDALEQAYAEDAVQQAVAHFGRIDIALLNVGGGLQLNTAKASAEVIKAYMRLNYDTMIHFFCPLVCQMKLQEEGGVIAHTNSLAGFLGVPMAGQYSAAKAAARIFLETARFELKPYHIRILTLYPGFVSIERDAKEGIPKPFLISVESAAKHILKALRLEMKEYMFPTSMKAVILLQRFLPQSIKDKIFLKALPPEY
jgi:short-subunit dehydrogenase